jgi:hypothetical protein
MGRHGNETRSGNSLEKRESGIRALHERERALARQFNRAKTELATFGWVLAGVLAIFGLLPFWDEPVMPSATRALIAAMNTLSLVFLCGWFVSKMLWLPTRLRSVRDRLEAIGATTEQRLR